MQGLGLIGGDGVFCQDAWTTGTIAETHDGCVDIEIDVFGVCN